MAICAQRARTAVLAVSAVALLAACVSVPRAPSGPTLILSRSATPSEHNDGAEALFAQMAIEVAPGEHARYLAGDNRAGYFEGRTHAYAGGIGYRIGEASFVLNRASFVEGQRLRREAQADREWVLPYGSGSEYPQASESLLLHAGEQAISLRVESDTAAELALMPLLGEALSGHRIELAPGALLLVPPADAPLPRADGHPAFVAISADRSVRIETAPTLTAEDRSALPIAEGAPQLRFATTDPQPRLSLHVAYADSRAEALKIANRLASRDSWSDQLALRHARLARAHLDTGNPDYDRALLWARASALDFVVDQYGPGIWAGLPWFRDNWGRDTFIALPGTLLVAGLFDEARAVLDAFARRQQRDPASIDYGRVPNRVATNQPVIYNTVDGTPWLLRAGTEYVRYTGDVEFADVLLEVARHYIAGAQKHLDEEGLLRHAEADTWMDARVFENGPAWSPRSDRAVEIQALWITALESAALLAEARGVDAGLAADWRKQAARARVALLARFWDGERMADRLRADGSRDLARRPNALMLLSVPWTPLLSDEIAAKLLRDSVEHLLFPYGIASLDPAHPHFHPRHENPDRHHKDAAYHNGTVWGWNAGFTVTALNSLGQQELAWRLSQELGRQILEADAIGSMSELLDAALGEDGLPKPSGTYAQSWSVAEFARNAFQDYLGFRPDLLRNTLAFVPALPSEWREVRAELPFGRGEVLAVRVRRVTDSATHKLSVHKHAPWSAASERSSPLSHRGRGAGGEGAVHRKSGPPLPNPSPTVGEGLEATSDATTDRFSEWRFDALTAAPRQIQLDLLDATGGRQRVTFELAAHPRVLRWDGHNAELDGEPIEATRISTGAASVLQGLDFATPPIAEPQRYPMLRGRDVLRREILDAAEPRDQSP
jgi:glycogen debranching enzyme